MHRIGFQETAPSYGPLIPFTGFGGIQQCIQRSVMLALRLTQSKDVGTRIVLIHQHIIMHVLITARQLYAPIIMRIFRANRRQYRQPLITARTVIVYSSCCHRGIRESSLPYPIGIHRSGHAPFIRRTTVQYDTSACLLTVINLLPCIIVRVKSVGALITCCYTPTERTVVVIADFRCLIVAVVRHLCLYCIGCSVGHTAANQLTAYVKRLDGTYLHHSAGGVSAVAAALRTT